MSLINDALKRANQAQKRQTPNAPVTPAPVHSPLQPVEAPPKSGSVPWTAIIIVVVLLLGAGSWFIVTAKHTFSEPAPEPVAVASAPVQVSTPAPASVPPPTPIPVAPASVPVAVVAPPKPAPVAVQPVTVAPAPPIVVASAPVAPVPKPVPVVAPIQPAPAATEPAPVTTPVVASAPVVPPQMPPLKLQGIFYRLTKSSTMINGRVLFVGESIDGVKVVKIERQHVVVEFHGERHILDF